MLMTNAEADAEEEGEVLEAPAARQRRGAGAPKSCTAASMKTKLSSDAGEGQGQRRRRLRPAATARPSDDRHLGQHQRLDRFASSDEATRLQGGIGKMEQPRDVVGLAEGEAGQRSARSSRRRRPAVATVESHGQQQVRDRELRQRCARRRRARRADAEDEQHAGDGDERRAPTSALRAHAAGRAAPCASAGGRGAISRSTRGPRGARRRRRASGRRPRGSRPATSRWARISSSVPWATMRPWSMIATSSHSRSTTSSTWVVKNRVTPLSARRRRRSVTTRPETGSMPFSGSSRKSTCGLWMRAAARATFFRMPCE